MKTFIHFGRKLQISNTFFPGGGHGTLKKSGKFTHLNRNTLLKNLNGKPRVLRVNRFSKKSMSGQTIAIDSVLGPVIFLIKAFSSFWHVKTTKKGDD